MPKYGGENWNNLTRSYSIWDDDNIIGFFGGYKWLSNFWPCQMYHGGLLWGSSEECYQAQKISPEQRADFNKRCYCDPAKSKKLWKEYPPIYTAEQWDIAKLDIMKLILIEKFSNPELKQMLLDTGNKYLEERNHWHDSCWGTDYKTGKGENHLGKMLMKTREFWRT